MTMPGNNAPYSSGSGARLRPTSPISALTSTGPAPVPPASSLNGSPRMPISASDSQIDADQPVSVSDTARIFSMS